MAKTTHRLVYTWNSPALRKFVHQNRFRCVPARGKQHAKRKNTQNEKRIERENVNESKKKHHMDFNDTKVSKPYQRLLYLGTIEAIAPGPPPSLLRKKINRKVSRFRDPLIAVGSPFLLFNFRIFTSRQHRDTKNPPEYAIAICPHGPVTYQKTTLNSEQWTIHLRQRQSCNRIPKFWA